MEHAHIKEAANTHILESGGPFHFTVLRKAEADFAFAGDGRCIVAGPTEDTLGGLIWR